MADGIRATLSLRSRMAIAVTAVLLMGGVVVLAAALAYGRQAAREAYDRLLVGAANDIAGAVSVRGGEVLVDLPLSAFELLALAPDDRIRYRVTGPGGETLTGDPGAPLPRAQADTVFYDGDFGDEPARYAAVTRRFAERSFSGPVQVVVGHTLRARREMAGGIARNAVLMLGGAGALMALFSWLVVAQAMRPLSRIGAVLARRDPTDLTPLSTPAPREVATLLSAFNGFMARLDRQAASTRNLIGDVAHQLRTPVATLRAQAQLAGAEPDPARRARLLDQIQSRAAGLGQLLEQLLSRAMIIHRADTQPRSLIDLRSVAVEVLEACDGLIETTGTEVTPQLPDTPVTVRGDELSLAEAGKNLLVNALRHGAPPLRIGVTGGARPSLWVQDAGQGPPAHLDSQIGTRFAAPGKSGGSGIGLAIAREVAEGHGGRLALSRTAQGFTAALELPPPAPGQAP